MTAGFTENLEAPMPRNSRSEYTSSAMGPQTSGENPLSLHALTIVFKSSRALGSIALRAGSSLVWIPRASFVTSDDPMPTSSTPQIQSEMLSSACFPSSMTFLPKTPSTSFSFSAWAQ